MCQGWVANATPILYIGGGWALVSHHKFRLGPISGYQRAGTVLPNSSRIEMNTLLPCDL